jgi:hypothetical protein
VFTQSLEGHEPDAFDKVVVIKKDVPAYSRPDEASPVSLRYSYDVLKKAGGSTAGWWQIELAPSKSVYVHRSDARSPTDYRACFAERAGRWIMKAFVAGD